MITVLHKDGLRIAVMLAGKGELRRNVRIELGWVRDVVGKLLADVGKRYLRAGLQLVPAALGSNAHGGIALAQRAVLPRLDRSGLRVRRQGCAGIAHHEASGEHRTRRERAIIADVSGRFAYTAVLSLAGKLLHNLIWH